MKTFCALAILLLSNFLYSCQSESPSSQPILPTPTTVAVPAESATVFTIPANFWKAPDEGPIIALPATVKLKAMTVKHEEFISLEMLQKLSSDPQLVQDRYAYTLTFDYDERGKPRWLKSAGNGNTLIISSSTQFGLSDTLILNPSGYATQRIFTGYGDPTPKEYTYSPDNMLTSETIRTIDGCGLPTIKQLTQKHTILNGNRVATEIIESKNDLAVISIRYEFDQTRLNTGLGFDTFRMFSGCSGLFMAFGTPTTYIFGNFNKNLIRKAIVKDQNGDIREYFYRYAFDPKGRVKTLSILYSYKKLILGTSGTPYAIQVRDYQYED